MTVRKAAFVALVLGWTSGAWTSGAWAQPSFVPGLTSYGAALWRESVASTASLPTCNDDESERIRAVRPPAAEAGIYQCVSGTWEAISGTGGIDGGTATDLDCTGCVAGEELVETYCQQDGTDCPAGGSTPGGSGTELQYRSGASFAAVADSSVSMGDVTLGGSIRLADFGDGGGLAVAFTADSGAGIWRQDGTGMHLRWGGSDRATVQPNGVTVQPALAMVPQPTPPVTCSAGMLGYSYVDSSGGDCFCNGVEWVNRGLVGACS